MEKGKRVEREAFPLPEPIIQHIQSFLDAKQAAQTSILSKLWYSAWLTRPILDLDELNFIEGDDDDPECQIVDGFSEFARKTIQRYEDLNLKVESFRLQMETLSDRNSLAQELITKALKMGVNDFNFEIYRPDEEFVLPGEVLRSKNLITLSLTGCTIDRQMDGKISCSRLKSLSLISCIVNDVVWDIISSCPMIEKLLLVECECYPEGNAHGNVTDMWMWRPSSEGCSEFHRLKYLSLSRLTIDRSFFHDFSLKFPCLEDLSISWCEGYEEIQISSHSLKCIDLAHMANLRAHFDVPSIHKFEFTGRILPSLSFSRVSGEWESNISIASEEYHFTPEWFFELKTLLKNLDGSKISLSISFYRLRHVSFVGQIEGIPGPVVENLKVGVHTPSAVCLSLLEGLFWSCRPRFITQYWFRKSILLDNIDPDYLQFIRKTLPEYINKDFLQLLCKTLIPEMRHSCCSLNQDLSGLHDFEEFVGVFEHTRGKLRPVPWKAFLDAPGYLENDHEIRFQLKWDSPDYAHVSNIPTCERVWRICKED